MSWRPRWRTGLRRLATLRRLRRVGGRQRDGSVSVRRGETATALDRRMMRRAIELAREAATHGEVPVGAVIWRLDDHGAPEVVAEAFNVRETKRDPIGHAEILALRLASEHLGRWRLDDCSIAVTLEPCPMCAGALVNARILRLVYGATDPKAGACESLYSIADDHRLNHRLEVIGGVLARRCGALLTTFFRARRKAR